MQYKISHHTIQTNTEHKHPNNHTHTYRCPDGEKTACPGGMQCFGNTGCYYSDDLVPTSTPIQSPTSGPSTTPPVAYLDPMNVRYCVSSAFVLFGVPHYYCICHFAHGNHWLIWHDVVIKIQTPFIVDREKAGLLPCQTAAWKPTVHLDQSEYLHIGTHIMVYLLAHALLRLHR